MLTFLMADVTLIYCSISSWKAILAEDTVAIKYESSCIFEAWMTFVPMYLKFFVHNRLILIIVIMKLIKKHSQSKLNFTSNMRIIGNPTRHISRVCLRSSWKSTLQDISIYLWTFEIVFFAFDLSFPLFPNEVIF
jgi:hypothetical protein